MGAITRVGSRHALLTLFLCFVARRSEAVSHEDVNEIRRLREENRQLKSEATPCDNGPSRQPQRQGGASASAIFAAELTTGAPDHASRRVLSHDDPKWEASQIGYTVIAPTQGHGQFAELETDVDTFSRAAALSYSLAYTIFTNGSLGACIEASDTPHTLDTMGSREYVGQYAESAALVAPRLITQACGCDTSGF